MARLTSDFFVSQMIRRVSGEGGFAAIVKKGSSEAGAIYAAVRQRSGTIDFYGPAPQQSYDSERPVDRYFLKIEHITSDQDIAAFTEREKRFDPDFWLIELEIDPGQTALPFEITTL
ncbi:MAG: DUF1491 family protein [Rhizobiaceae bacterium]